MASEEEVAEMHRESDEGHRRAPGTFGMFLVVGVLSFAFYTLIWFFTCP